MKKSDQLKQERTVKQDAQNAIIQKAKTENREWTPEEEAQFDTLDGEIEGLNKSIERALKAEKVEIDIAKRGAKPVGDKGNDDEPPSNDGEAKEKQRIYQRFSIATALRTLGNLKELTGAEKEVHEIGLQESRNAGLSSSDVDNSDFSLPMSLYSRATQQTVTQDSGAYGGALVQNAAPVMVDPLRPRLWLEDIGATFMTGLKGNVPLVVDADFDMEWLAEGASITPQKKGYAGPTLAPKRAGGAVDITNQLIMQSSPDVEALIMRGIRFGFQRLLNSAALNGAGGTAPTGLLSYSGVQASSQVTEADATWATIVELQALIESENGTEKSLAYIMHPKLKAALKQIKKDAGSGRFLLEGKEVDGYTYISTTLMPILDGTDDLYPLIYGDFSQMYIGQWGSINIKVNPYSADLADSVRLTLNTHADMKIANPKAFAKNAYLTV